MFNELFGPWPYFKDASKYGPFPPWPSYTTPYTDFTFAVEYVHGGKKWKQTINFDVK